MRSLQTRRVAAAAVAVPVLLSLALGGAGSAQSPSAPAPDTSITGAVTFWNGYAADGAEITTFTDQVLPAFQARYPNITVNHQEIPYDDLRQKLVTGIAGGTLPDVLRSDITWVPEFADQGVLLPLDQEMSDFADVTAGVFPGPLSTNKFGDHYYGLPLDTNTRVLFANTDVLTKAGITALPTTIDEFETMLKTVKDKLGTRRLWLRRRRHRRLERAALDLEHGRWHHDRRPEHRSGCPQWTGYRGGCDQAQGVARCRLPVAQHPGRRNRDIGPVRQRPDSHHRGGALDARHLREPVS